MPKIMIVDDDVTIQMETEEYLTHMDYTVVGTADTGKGAIEMARETVPDLILMDVNLPGEMDGIEAAEKIKAELDIAIIFISGYGDPEHIEKAKEIEPFGYVMKPFDEKEIRAFIEIALHKKAVELKLRKANEQLEQTNRDLKQEIKEREQTEEALRESENRLQIITDTALDSIFCKDVNRRYTFVNSSMIQLMDCTEADLIGKVPEEVLRKEDAAIVAEADERTLKGENVSEVGSLFIAGKQYTFHIIQVPLHDADGNITGISGIVRDITDVAQAEEALHIEKDFTESLINTAQAIILVLDTKGRIVRFNAYMEDLSGYKLEEVQGRDWFSTFLPEQDYEQIRGLFRAAVSDMQTRGNINPIVAKDGHEIIVEWYDKTLKDADGNTIGLLAIGQDITERKQAEEALRRSEALLSMAGRTARFGGWSSDSDGHEVVWSEQVALIHEKQPGYSPTVEEAIQYYAPEWKDKIAVAFQICIREGTPYDEEMEIITAGGHRLWVRTTGEAVRDNMGKIVRAQGSFQDISERKRAEAALLESEERFRTVADFTYDWEYWLAPDGHPIYVSPSCERITGYGSQDFFNDPGLLEKIAHPDDHSDIVNHLAGEHNLEKLPSFDFRIITRSGEERWISHLCQAVYGADGTHLGRRGSNRDITKQMFMQEELLKAKKLESLGVLAGGIAHDFNNLMSAVVGYISLARMEMKPGSKGFKNLIGAEKASIQTKELTARLITFSKGGRSAKETVSIGDLVKNSVDSFIERL